MEWFEKAKKLSRRELETEIRSFRCDRITAGAPALPPPPEVLLPAGWVNTIQQGDCLCFLKMLPDDSIDFCMTSPPYWGLRDYGVMRQLGLESTWQEYVERSLGIYRELRRILKTEGSFYLNLADTYSTAMDSHGGRTTYEMSRSDKVDEVMTEGEMSKIPKDIPPKSLIGIPWRVALAMIDDGWTLRNAIIWHKPNSMPSSVKDRLSNTYEFVFHFVKSPQYYYDLDAIREICSSVGRRNDSRKPENLASEAGNKETYKLNRHASRTEGKYTKADRERIDPRYDPGSGPMSWAAWKEGHPSTTHPLGKNPGDVIAIDSGDFWKINTQPFPEAHFAVYPEELCVKPIESSCPEGGIVLDIFAGAGTTLLVAKRLGRKYLGFEINPGYIEIANRRLAEIG